MTVKTRTMFKVEDGLDPDCSSGILKDGKRLNIGEVCREMQNPSDWFAGFDQHTYNTDTPEANDVENVIHRTESRIGSLIVTVRIAEDM